MVRFEVVFNNKKSDMAKLIQIPTLRDFHAFRVDARWGRCPTLFVRPLLAEDLGELIGVQSPLTNGPRGDGRCVAARRWNGTAWTASAESTRPGTLAVYNAASQRARHLSGGQMPRGSPLHSFRADRDSA